MIKSLWLNFLMGYHPKTVRAARFVVMMDTFIIARIIRGEEKLVEIAERCKGLFAPHKREYTDEEMAQKLRDYISEPGYVGPEARPLILSNPTPCAECGDETTVLLFPSLLCWECFTNKNPLYVVELCRCEECLNLARAERMFGAALRGRLRDQQTT